MTDPIGTTAASPSRRRHSTALLLVVLSVGAVAFWLTASMPAADSAPYAEFQRADGQYRIVVTRKRSWHAVMPGQAGDSPGTATLIDRNGRVLQRADLAMVQLVEQVDWQPNKVSIKLVGEWPLPD